MKQYIGVKFVEAEPMTAGEFNKIKPEGNCKDRNPEDDGYMVKYPQGDGYISWCPKDVFEESNREVGNLTFGLAIEAMKQGKRVARKGWNGKGMFLYHVNGTMVDKEYLRNEASLQPIEDETGTVQFNSHIDMSTADGSVCVGWLASQADMLAEDWQIVE